MILQYYVEPLSRVASRGFSKNQICRTGCGHTREREGWPTAPLPVSRPRPGSARSWKREVLANYLDPKVPGPSFPRGWGSSLQLFAHGRGGNWDSRVLCLSVWSAGQCHPRACPAPSRQTANPVFFFKLCFFDFCLFSFRDSLACFQRETFITGEHCSESSSGCWR